MIVEDDSSGSDVEGRLSVSPALSGRGRSKEPSASPQHFVRFKPLMIGEEESEEEDDEHLQLPGENLRARRTSEAVAKWRSQRWESVDSFSSDDDQETHENTPLLNKQLYLLVARCIAYPFNSRFQIETAPPKPRLSNESYLKICDVLQAAIDVDKTLQQHLILNGNELKTIVNADFLERVEWYLNNILARDDVRVACVSGNFSIKELENVFRVSICQKFRSKFEGGGGGGGDKVLNKKVESDPKFQIWVCTFVKLIEHGSQSVMSEKELRQINKQMSLEKQELYSMFQNILGVAKSDHQALFRTCHLNNSEEQEDVVRREIHKRRELLKKGECSFYWKNQSAIIQAAYFEEMDRKLRELTENLESRSMTSSEYGMREKKKKATDSVAHTYTKNDFQFHHKVKVTVRDASQIIGVAEGKNIFIVFELEGNNPLATKSVPLNTKHIALFEEGGEFWTNTPLPQLSFILKLETQGLLSSEKSLAKKMHTVMPTAVETTEDVELQRSDGTVLAHLRVSTYLERPGNMRKCGYLYCAGDFAFKQWRSRFLALLQMSQFSFVFCHYQPKDTHPREFIVLEGYTVQYLTEDPSGEDEIRYFFTLSSEKGVIKFGCVTSAEREQWVQWLTRATGQTDKPKDNKPSLTSTSSLGGAGGGDLVALGVADVVNMDVAELDHPKMFTKLFKSILSYRLKEIDFSRGFFSPGQMYVIDEYCARYCIRLSHRHLTCLWEWLQCELKGQRIWPVMMLHSFGFCQMHVMGQKPQEHSEVVTPEEKKQWFQLSGQIEILLSEKLENFREHFPFSCPKDDLKISMKLFTLVAEINHSQDSKHLMPLYSEDTPLRLLISILERAALNNYKKIFAKLWQFEELELDEFSDHLNVDQLYTLAHMCVDFMYELHEFYTDDFTLYPLALVAHIDAFWSFFVVDLQECLRVTDVSIISLLKMFYSLNEYFCTQPALKLSKFHQTLLQEFEPLVDKYLTGLNENIRTDLEQFLQYETWLPVNECCYSMQGCLEALNSIKVFVEQLNWPQDPYATSLVTKVQSICADKFEIVVKFTQDQCENQLKEIVMKTGLLLPKPIITMVNTIMFLSAQAASFCGFSQSSNGQVPEEQQAIAVNMTASLEASVDAMLSSVIQKLCEPFKEVLDQMSKHDPTASLFSSLKKIVPGQVPTDVYCNYVKGNLQHLSGTLVSAAFNNFVLNWYESQLRMLNQWVRYRPTFSLNGVQQDAIEALIQDIRQLFMEVDLDEEQLETESYGQIEDRLRKERAQAALMGQEN